MLILSLKCNMRGLVIVLGLTGLEIGLANLYIILFISLHLTLGLIWSYVM